MIWRIMRHDFQILAADKILWIVAALLLVLTAGGIYNGAKWAQERKQSVEGLERKALEELNQQKAEALQYESGAKTRTATTPPALLPTGKSVPVILPPAPLAALSVGQSDIYPYTTNVNLMTEKNDLFQEYEQDNPLQLLTGKFDLAFVLVFVFPLLILALSYNLLSSEKESGTLSLTMANAAVGIKKIVAGKLLARLLLVLALIGGFSVIGLMLSGIDFSNSETLFRICLFILAVAVYACFWFAAALLVNSFGFSSATNATLLGGVWVLIAVIMPSFLNVVATSVYPVPSRLEFVSKIREADNQTRSEGEKYLKSYYGDHPELAPPDGMSKSQASERFYAIRQERQKRLMPEVERFETQLAAQQNMLANFRVLSPPVVMQETLNDLAGTSTQRQKSYVAQIREQITALQNYLVPKLMRRELLQSTDYEKIPRFVFQEETMQTIAKRAGIGIILMLIPALLLGGLTFTRLRRFSLLG